MTTPKSQQLPAAIKKAANILAYSDNTRAKLIEKLRRAGYDADVCEAAADEMTAKGMLNEERMVIHAVEYMAEVKLFGRRRIYAELNKKGFSRQAVENCVPEVMDAIDFEEACLKLAKKQRFEHSEAGRMKLTRTLMRYGFGGDEIRYAMKNLKINWRAQSDPDECEDESDGEFLE
ncbi:MAG: RecX family transcriptional regulator [Clostridia bacterium]|nr:RecX family transcriptional regulator [Clostridia bacterium]MBQ4575860.1 RecX family transcriptional regulator [Clostridia bacterium]